MLWRTLLGRRRHFFTIWLASKKRYGSPRITMALAKAGRLISDNTVAEIMVAIDITYIPTDEGFLYLCAILDVFTRRLVGWYMATHMATELCLDALNAAMMSLRVSRIDTATILHSDYAEVFVKPRNPGLACAGRAA